MPNKLVAIDLGTTTICYKINDVEFATPNPNRRHGADIISRLDYAVHGGAAQLQSELLERIAPVLSDAASVIITGNTAMLHLLTGQDAKGLVSYPFTPATLFGYSCQLSKASVYIPRCISPFIGSDITVGIMASGLLGYENAILVDIGTNGEIVLKCGDRLFACSTSAGPAFEGCGLSCGMPAIDGAIYKITNGNPLTIGNKPPLGYCGSGIIDALAIMLKTGTIDHTGLITTHSLALPVQITQKDVRNIQLAKSAIRAGIETLLHNARLAHSDIEAILIAGSFGEYISIANATKIGIIPPNIKAISVGNTSLKGANMLLQNSALIPESERITFSTHLQELATDPYFSEKYIEYLDFPQ